MKILITGIAGFIGFHVAKILIEKNINIIGVDNLNNYYDVNFKKKRLEFLKKLDKKKKLKFYKIDISIKKDLDKIKKFKIDYVIHLAAQAGVRHSLKKPEDYIKNNLIGFFNILEYSRIKNIKHLLFASSSSVYGNENRKCQEYFDCNTPLQFYAATKKSNEMMAHAYSSIHKMAITGLRFFTVYGPWGRPDMSLFIFTRNILNRKEISVFNYGNHKRDFTYVADVARSIYKILFKPSKKKIPYDIYNIGNSSPVKLKQFIEEIEINLKKNSIKKFLPLQKGDVANTNSDSRKLYKKIKYKPKTSYRAGVKKFVEWYHSYFNK